MSVSAEVLPKGWTEHVHDTGEPYYIHTQSKQIQWQRPTNTTIEGMENYVYQDLLGNGRFGVALLMTHRNNDEKVVIKVVGGRPGAMEEVKILKSLSHPNITKFETSFLHNDKCHIVMEYCEGGDLRKYLQKCKGVSPEFRIPEINIMRWVNQLCEGLAYLHSKKYIHRDIKPENIFLTGDESEVKIGDLGIAKDLNKTSYAKTVAGTNIYMAPEICKMAYDPHVEYKNKVDTWSLGIVSYELTTLKCQFEIETDRKGNFDYTQLLKKQEKIDYNPISGNGYSSFLSELIKKMLQFKHQDRPSILDILQMQYSQASEPKDQGNKEFQKGNFNEAIDLYTKAVSMNSKDHILYSKRYEAFAMLGKYRKAEEDADKIISMMPKWAKGYQLKGAALQYLSRWPEAVASYEDGLKFDQTNQQMKDGLAVCKVSELKDQGNTELQKGNLDEAIDLYTKAISLDPKNRILYSNRSEAYARQEKYSEAEEDADKTISIMPEWAKGYQLKGAALQYLSRWSEAVATYEEGLKLDQSNQQMKDGLAVCKEEQRKKTLREEEERQKQLNKELLQAAGTGRVEDLQAVINAGGDINYKDEYGRTALWYAASRGHDDCVKVLIHQPTINVNAANNNGRTALWQACCMGWEAVVKLMLQYQGPPHNININTASTSRPYQGLTPLGIALKEKYAAIARLLRAAGAQE